MKALHVPKTLADFQTRLGKAIVTDRLIDLRTAPEEIPSNLAKRPRRDFIQAAELWCGWHRIALSSLADLIDHALRHNGDIKACLRKELRRRSLNRFLERSNPKYFGDIFAVAQQCNDRELRNFLTVLREFCG